MLTVVGLQFIIWIGYEISAIRAKVVEGTIKKDCWIYFGYKKGKSASKI